MPTIGQPGRVASDKNTAQEILDALTDDQTEFSGSDIDTSISSRATPADTGSGVDWSSKTPKLVVVPSGTTTNITGSGYLLGASAIGALSSQRSTQITIDGVDLLSGSSFSRIKFADSPGVNHLSFLYRFNSSMALSCSGVSGEVGYYFVLD
jgi:hypothetical protein